MTIRTLIVDDEPLARKRLRTLLESEGDIEVVAECGNGREALPIIADEAPNLLFLDVEMPELDGFGLIETVGPSAMPATVFVTAYERYAVQAFEAHAVDYLLKPFDRARFQRALDQAREQLKRQDASELNERLKHLLDDLRVRQRYVDRLAVKSSGRLVFLKVDEIEWIDAAGNYVRLNAGGKTYLLRETMGALEKKLDREKFLRIHRSTIVNVDEIEEIRPLQHGEHAVRLKNGTRLNLSRGYRDKLAQLAS